MITSKLRLNYGKLTDSGMLAKAHQILQDMTANPNFTTPIPTLADLQLAISEYSVALVNASNLGRLYVAEKIASRKKLAILLNQLGLYVMYVANGDEVILTSSGFDLAKQPESSFITNPGAVTLSNGITTGQVVSQVPPQSGSKGYNHQYTLYPVTAASVWTSNPTNRSKSTFNGLEAGKKYAVRVAVVGKNGELAFSPVATMFVQ